MGCLYFFDKQVSGRDSRDQPLQCNVEVVDNHSIPEVRLMHGDGISGGLVAEFIDWTQFVEFKEAIDSVYTRLRAIHK